jgi:peptidoglycan/xylan/chitin deacetylase (PgdA/CDA1 family)
MIWMLSLLLLGLGAVSILWFQPHFLIKRLTAWYPDVLFHVETERKAIALTIDDAPHPKLTPRILDVLSRHDVKATFFLMGGNVTGNENILIRMRAEGHELANHMMQDRPTIFLSLEDFAQRLLAADNLIQPTGKYKWFRPGSGWFSGRMIQQARSLGYRCCLGSIYPHDNKLRRPGWITQAVVDRVYPGAIIVLHEGFRSRDYVVTVLEELIPTLKEKGYNFLTVSELYALQDPPAESPSDP